MAYRKGHRDLPEDFPTCLKWEEAWMKSIMENKGALKPPMPQEITTVSPFSGQTKVTVRADLDQHSSKAVVKQETVAFPQAFRQLPRGISIG